MIHETELFARLHDRQFVISAQIDPPLTSVEGLDTEIGQLRKAGVTVIDVNSRSRLSLDATRIAQRYKRMFSFEVVIPHLTPRNATIFGLLTQVHTTYNMDDIHDFLIITGDPQEITDQPNEQKQPDAIEAILAIDKLRRDRNLSITLAGATNQYARDLSHEIDRTQQKIKAGADFLMSQTVFDPRQIEHTVTFFKKVVGPNKDIPFMIGLWQITSMETVKKIHNGDIPGVVMPEDIFQEAISQADDEALRTWNEQKTAELVKYIKGDRAAQGIYIVAPNRKPSRIIPLLQRLAE